jgi:3-methylfumaryl-CoA hydratase
MWAASEMRYRRPLRVGETVEKRSRIADVSVKQGRSGTLAFVTVEHIYARDGVASLTETQMLVYRDAPARGEAPPPVQSASDNAAPGSARYPPAVPLFRRHLQRPPHPL